MKEFVTPASNGSTRKGLLRIKAWDVYMEMYEDCLSIAIMFLDHRACRPELVQRICDRPAVLKTLKTLDMEYPGLKNDNLP